MNAPQNPQQAAQPANDAFCAADRLLKDAYEAIPVIIPEHQYREMEHSTVANLAAAHAVVAKLNEMESALRKEIGSLRESIDFLSKTLIGQ